MRRMDEKTEAAKSEKAPDLFGIWASGVLVAVLGGILLFGLDHPAAQVIGIISLSIGGVVLQVATVATGVVVGGRILAAGKSPTS